MLNYFFLEVQEHPQALFFAFAFFFAFFLAAIPFTSFHAWQRESVLERKESRGLLSHRPLLMADPLKIYKSLFHL